MKWVDIEIFFFFFFHVSYVQICSCYWSMRLCCFLCCTPVTGKKKRCFLFYKDTAFDCTFFAVQVLLLISHLGDL